MLDLDKDSKDILVAALIGGVVGICITSVYCASKSCDKSEKKSSLGSIGRVILQVGELLNDKDLCPSALKSADKKVHKYENTVTDVLELISVGMSLWEKIRKGV